MSDYNRENHHDEHHETIERLRIELVEMRQAVDDVGYWFRRCRRIEEAARDVMGLYNVDKEYGIDAMSPEWGRLRAVLADQSTGRLRAALADQPTEEK